MRQHHQVFMKMPAISHSSMYCSSQCFYPPIVLMLVENLYVLFVIEILSLDNSHAINKIGRRMYVTLDGRVLYPYGSSKLIVEINSTTFRMNFDLVNDHFPIPGAGIIGPDFCAILKLKLF